ncbi:unnamed protein product [Brachionus calyciflorus]|uniref:Uncharacterized protein n=1 Tax=Brachionus calyciflorus TaxID=104777 RepID=A0A814ETS7_9BILA|nr:unnamed protein product [Brachionus calyciflorus]
MKRIAAMLIINRKKKGKFGVAQQNISSYDEDENVKEDLNDQDTDEKPEIMEIKKMLNITFLQAVQASLFNYLNNL